MTIFYYKGHKVFVFKGYDGKSMIINNAAGEKVYAHKFMGDAREWAAHVIG